MKANYLCEDCRGILNIKYDIILSAKNSKNGALILVVWDAFKSA